MSPTSFMWHKVQYLKFLSFEFCLIFSKGSLWFQHQNLQSRIQSSGGRLIRYFFLSKFSLIILKLMDLRLLSMSEFHCCINWSRRHCKILLLPLDRELLVEYCCLSWLCGRNIWLLALPAGPLDYLCVHSVACLAAASHLYERCYGSHSRHKPFDQCWVNVGLARVVAG